MIADNLGAVVEIVYGDPAAATGPEVIVATYAFAWQIYCDFSGYTDVARGLSRLMGFELMLNFNLPYLATSPADFWRRWHISLSTWLRDYLYISLGGNRGSSLLTYRNLGLTMLLGGLWHGAAWTFVVWGAYQGLLLIVHRMARPLLARLEPAGSFGRGAWWLLRVVIMFQLACLGWMIFRADSMPQLVSLLEQVSVFEPGRLGEWWLPLAALILPLAVFQVIQAATRDLEIPLRWPLPVRSLVYATTFFALVVLGEDFGDAFIYFQF